MITVIFLFCILTTSVSSSECELSEWSGWSRCYGTCYYALSVRNRDVIRPAIPENSLDRVKRCAKLYETRFCSLRTCEDSPVATADLPSRSGRHRPPSRMIHKKNLLSEDRLQNRELQMTSTEQGMNGILQDDRKPVTKLEDIRRSKRLHGNTIQTVEAHQYPLIESISQGFSEENMAENEPQLRYNMMNNETKTSDLVATSDLPKRLKPARERLPMDGKGKWRISEDIGDLKASEAAIHGAIHDLESFSRYNIPLSDKNLRKILFRNRLFMRALIESHQLHTTPSTITATTTPYFVKKATTIATTKIEEDPIITMSTNEKDSSISEEVSTLTSSLSSNPNNTTTNASNTNNTQNSRITLGSELLAGTQSDGVDGKSTASYDHFTNRNNFHSVGFPKNLPDSIEITFDSDENSNFNTTSTNKALAATILDNNSERGNTLPLDKLFNLGKIADATTKETTVSALTTMTPASSPLPYWPKKGYVPNTRKHASEITSKLYMTQEIIQAFSDGPIRRSSILRLDCLESRRCCRVTRTQCSDGTTPKYVKRYYRPRGAETCLPYYYPRCSNIEEMDEQPIQYEQNCQDICFKGPEKRISPLFKIAFEN